MRNEMGEAYDNRKAHLRMIADFVQKILTSKTPSHRTTVDFSDKPTTPLKQTVTPSLLHHGQFIPTHMKLCTRHVHLHKKEVC